MEKHAGLGEGIYILWSHKNVQIYLLWELSMTEAM